MPRNPNKTRCSVPGCQGWAMRGSQPPLCSPHRLRPDLAERIDDAADAHPLAISAPAGQRLPGAPPGNQNRLVHGYYAQVRQPQDHAGIDAYVVDSSLDHEIVAVRAVLDRILEMLQTGHTPGPSPKPLGAADYGRYAGLAFQGAGVISRLLRARRALAGDQGGAFSRIMNDALDELGQELGVDL